MAKQSKINGWRLKTHLSKDLFICRIPEICKSNWLINKLNTKLFLIYKDLKLSNLTNFEIIKS